MGNRVLVESICMAKSIRIQNSELSRNTEESYSTLINYHFSDAHNEYFMGHLHYMGIDAKKSVFVGQRTTQAQTSLRIRAV